MRFLLTLILLWPMLAAPALAAPDVRYRYEIIPERSRVSFALRGGLLLVHDAYFGVVRGEILLTSGDDPFEGASGWIRVETASLRAEDSLREAMIGGQVLETAKYPSAELRVTGVKALGPPERRGRERDWEVEARGTLLLHGEERRVTFHFGLADTGVELYVRGEGELSLSDFGMLRPTTLLLVPGSDTVRVNVRLVARPAPRPRRP